MKRFALLIFVFGLAARAQIAIAQTTTPYAPEALSATDYARAEQFVHWNAEKLTSGTSVAPRWLDANRFWYRNQLFGGHEFIVIDAAARTRRPAFDHDRLAAALSEASEKTYDAGQLPFDEFEFTASDRIRFWTGDLERWECDVSSYGCTGPDSVARVTHEIVSPDDALAVFSRDENLWVRDLETDAERQLPTDGEPHFGYGVAPERCCQEITNRRTEFRSPPVAEWSPDGSRIATHRYDERDVEELHLLETATGRPILHSYRYALPGDSIVPTWGLYVFDASTGEGVRAEIDPMVGNFAGADTTWAAVQWSADGERVYFAHHARDFKTQTLVEMDASTGATRPVIVETGDTYVNQLTGLPPAWRVLDSGQEVVWFSERDGWGHLYLFDVASGQMKSRITSGPWVVLELLRVDEGARQVYFTAVGREPGRDPYRRHLYRASLDGGGVTLLTPEDMDHAVGVSPDGRYWTRTPHAPTLRSPSSGTPPGAPS